MLIKEIKTWAKNHGYNVSKNKDTNEYTWSKLDSNDPNDGGIALSVSKLATQIYNHLTNNKWVEHQEEFKKNFSPKKIETTDYGS
jgi:hypothetical protein